MTTLLPYITAGIVTGSIYALAALGVAIVYKGSGILNFAHGAMATTGVLVFAWTSDVLPVGVAALLGVLAVAALGVVADMLVFRPLVYESAAVKVMASVALLVALQALVAPQFTGRFLRLFPTGVLRTGSFTIGVDQLIVIVVTAALTVALFVFFQQSSWGIAIRAVADDPDSTSLLGVAPAVVSTVAWALGGGLAGLSGIMLAPFVGQDPIILTLLVIHAMAAVVVGNLDNLPLIVAGALVLGLLESLATRYVGTPGVKDLLPLIVILVVLAVPRRVPSWQPG